MLTCKGCIRGDQSGFESPEIHARILPALSVLIVFCFDQKPKKMNSKDFDIPPNLVLETMGNKVYKLFWGPG